MFAKSFYSRAGTTVRCTAAARIVMPLRSKVTSTAFVRKVFYFMTKLWVVLIME